MQKPLLVLTILAAVFAFSLFDISDYDEGWHVKLGEYVYQHGALPAVDPLSFTAPDKPAPLYSIIPDLVFYPAYHFAGFKGLIALRATLVAATFSILFAMLRRFSIKHWLAAAACLLAAYAAMRLRLSVRPFLFSLLCFTGVWALLLRSTDEKSDSTLIAATVLTLLNVHLHVDWYLTGLLWLILAACHLKKGVWNRYTRWGVANLALILFAAFLSPIGWQAVVEFPRLILTEPARHSQIIAELGPLAWKYKFFHFYFFTALFVIAAVALKRAWKKLPPKQLFILVTPLVFLILNVRLSRNFIFTTVAMVPAVVLGFELLLGKLAKHLRKPYRLAFEATLLAGAIVLAGSHRGPHFHGGLDPVQHSEQGLEFLSQHLPAGQMFNDSDFGGILALYLYPQKKIYIDNRSGVFPPEFFASQYEPVLQTQPGWEEIVARHHIGFFVLRSERSPLFDNLLASPQWTLIYWDPVMSIIAAKNDDNRALIETSGYQLFNPWNLEGFVEKSDDPRAERELQRLLQTAPDDLRLIYLRARLAVNHKDWKTALSDFELLLQRNARAFYPATNLGITLLFMGELDRADYFFKQGVERAPGDPYPRSQLKKFYSITGRTP